MKGAKLTDPLEETFGRVKGRKVSMDFAFKLVSDPTPSTTSAAKDSRVTTMNCFRHVNPDSLIMLKLGGLRMLVLMLLLIILCLILTLLGIVP